MGGKKIWIPKNFSLTNSSSPEKFWIKESKKKYFGGPRKILDEKNLCSELFEAEIGGDDHQREVEI